ncbi:MAG: IS110 family transposase [Oscillospiraceae bacterium]|nr:IS110 family transposase [Oscillospiraceae bacterium]
MNYIGIDISKHKHDVCVISDLGEVVNEGFSFTNNAKGFAQFLKMLVDYGGFANNRIGFEATGNYAINLKLFLEKNGFEFMEINPFLVKEYIKSETLRKTTTDKICARHIASYLLVKAYKPHRTGFYDNFALKQLTRFRQNLVKTRSKHLVQLTNVLDCIFPEFKPFFNGKLSVTALYILSHYPTPAAIANMKSPTHEKLRKVSHGHFSMAQFVELKSLAKNTVGVYQEHYGVQLEMLLDLYAHIDSSVDEVDAKIGAIIKELNPPTLSIRGVGETSTAVIVAECGDFSRFANSNKLLAFAGLEPGKFQSGTLSHEGKMVKRGSSHLRYALMNCANTVCLHNEVFAEYYRKKRNEGKKHNVARNHVAKKLVRIIFALETKGVMFDTALLR